MLLVCVNTDNPEHELPEGGAFLLCLQRVSRLLPRRIALVTEGSEDLAFGPFKLFKFVFGRFVSPKMSLALSIHM